MTRLSNFVSSQPISVPSPFEMDTPSYNGSSVSEISVSSSERSTMSFVEDGNDDLLDELLAPCDLFTTRVVIVEAGEDVGRKIIEFCDQQVPGYAVCIISATGKLSEITLSWHLSSNASVTYEGQFEILTLSGSFIPTSSGGSDRMGSLSISFAHRDARVVGGRVAGQLKAATSVMITVGSFFPIF